MEKPTCGAPAFGGGGRGGGTFLFWELVEMGIEVDLEMPFCVCLGGGTLKPVGGAAPPLTTPECMTNKSSFLQKCKVLQDNVEINIAVVKFLFFSVSSVYRHISKYI